LLRPNNSFLNFGCITNGVKIIKAKKYRYPANVIGEISASPHFIMINEVDHRKVTRSA
jgi:hypothetical protein